MLCVVQLSNYSFPAANSVAERRRKPRVQVHCAALVRGHNGSGEKIEEDAILDNVSASGLHLNLSHPVKQGARLFVLFNLSCYPLQQARSVRVAAQGIVVRAEPQPEGVFGLGVQLERYRLI
jgi:hypothetical protein